MEIRKPTIIMISASFIFFTYYYTYRDTNYKMNMDYGVKVVRFYRKKPMYIYNDTEDFLINTPGCYIPNYGKTLVFKDSKNYKKTCGERAIFIQRIGNEQLVFRIDTTILKKYSKSKKVQCSYMFARRSNLTGEEDTRLSYTEKKPFKTGTNITLEEEVITVICETTSNKKGSLSRSIVYEDAYVLVKKISKKKPISNDKRWNVLMIGMDTMSRARLQSSMPKTFQYFQEHGWLDYRAYHKVGSNTFPNLIAFMTGKKLGTMYKKCNLGMHKCNDLIIWSRFQNAGYITAYGEDNLRLPDTFFRLKGFQTIPTHHYMRPFFLTGETQNGNLICAKHKSSAAHLLNYANEFADIYKNDQFFGIFWMNSYSHNTDNSPKLLDNDMVSFFEKLNSGDVMNNTIVIFLSDHGIRFGDMRIHTMESYYEERLPMLFIWTPNEFQKLQAVEYNNMELNQNRLVTPYDLYVTLTELTNTPKVSDVENDACPKCTSLFEEKSAYRTCADAGISDKWCSCHNMTNVDNSKDIGANKSLQLAVKHLQNITHFVKTSDCTACHSLYLETVLRTYSYGADKKIHYVVAWQMAPGKVSFEVTVVREGNNYTILPMDTLSEYNRNGNCVMNSIDRPFCVCKSTKCL